MGEAKCHYVTILRYLLSFCFYIAFLANRPVEDFPSFREEKRERRRRLSRDLPLLEQK